MSSVPITANIKPGFEPVLDVFKANFETGEELGAGFAAFIGDECIVDIFGGWSDRQKKSEWQADTLVPIYSTTKPIAAMVAAMIVDQSVICLLYTSDAADD